jgi:hypothetical protein
VECEADFNYENRAASVNGKIVNASSLRSISVMSPSGASVNLGDTMGDGKAVLVLLRHLG